MPLESHGGAVGIIVFLGSQMFEDLKICNLVFVQSFIRFRKFVKKFGGRGIQIQLLTHGKGIVSLLQANFKIWKTE